MSEFTSETSQAAQEEVSEVQASPESNEGSAGETLGAATPGKDDSLEKDPNDWVSGDDPMTAAQKSYLDTLARQAGEEIPASINKAEASQHIERLKNDLGQ